ncbi:MAG: sensor histidine kinase [Acidobacteriia bacterium]|nr:sensor histidine kinase [Terriglobia bacterium]
MTQSGSMFALGNTPRFLTRLGAPVDLDERRRVERVLASARVLLAGAGLLAVYMDPTEPSRYANVAYAVLISYLVYSAVVWVMLNRSAATVPSFPWIHLLDLTFPAVVTLFSEGPNSAFFLYFVFVLTAAAFRWGFIETFATAVATVTVMTTEAALLSFGHPLGTWLEGEYEVNRFVIRSTYLILLGVLLGYLAEEEKQLRAEDGFITRVAGMARVETGLRSSMQAILGATMGLFTAPRALAVLRQNSSGRVFLWRSETQPNGHNSIGWSEIGAEEPVRCTVSLPAHSFYAQRRGSTWSTWAIDAEGKRTHPDSLWSPAQCPQIDHAASVLSTRLSMGEEWSGYLLLYNARTGRDELKEVRFAQKLFRRITPAIYNVYLLRRLRSRAGAMERARVARELHDGAIQALIAVEMEVDVLRREAARADNPAQLTPRLEHVQELLREQVFDLRTLMQQMRPLEVSSGQFLDRLADTVERFRRDTGIAAEFASALEEVELSPRTCRELVRIAQEALANVRKHSGAQRVLVRFGAQDGQWTLAVEDDGRGFAFVGKKSLAELDACRKGPDIIKERVRTLGGNLEIESLPGQGTRLQVTLPQRPQAAYV